MKATWVVIGAVIFVSLSFAYLASMIEGTAEGQSDRQIELYIMTFGLWSAIISAILFTWNTHISSRALVESQAPKVKITVEGNEPAPPPEPNDNTEKFHETRINYENVGTNEVRNFKMYAELTNDKNRYQLNIFSNDPTILQMKDPITKCFPTKSNLLYLGIPRIVVDSLGDYTLVVGFTADSLSGKIQRERRYKWDRGPERWQIP